MIYDFVLRRWAPEQMQRQLHLAAVMLTQCPTCAAVPTWQHMSSSCSTHSRRARSSRSSGAALLGCTSMPCGAPLEAATVRSRFSCPALCTSTRSCTQHWPLLHHNQLRQAGQALAWLVCARKACQQHTEGLCQRLTKWYSMGTRSLKSILHNR